jgi:hypothetical protein
MITNKRFNSKTVYGFFNLSKCQKTSLRRRTLSGTTCYYHVYFEPKCLDKHQRRVAIDSFKHPRCAKDKRISDEMIHQSIYEFLNHNTLDDFDVILGVPSSSGVVKKIIDILVNDYRFRGLVHRKGFTKTRIRNIKLKQYVIDREYSLKTKKCVPKAYQDTIRLHYDKVSKVSLFPTRFRRYFENFLKLNVSNRGCLKNKRILVVDDTFGEGLTMCEINRILTPYTNQVIGFAVMKDIV